MTQPLPVIQSTPNNSEAKPEKKPRTVNKALAVPDERFWIRYSPHHELPLSSVSSFGIHVVIIVLLVLVGWLAVRLGWNEKDRPLQVEAVDIVGGGGGNPDGFGKGPGVPNAGNPKEAVPDQPVEKGPTPEAPKADALKPVEATA